MRRGTVEQPAASTRDRILKAATLRFSRHSYEETRLRDIASDVGVDVAYVHRCFGSKERLFAEALISTVEPDRILAGNATEMAAELARRALARDASEGVMALDIFIRSLSSPEALRVVREAISRDLIVPLAVKLNEPHKQRAALIAAFVAGVRILADVLRLEPLMGDARNEVEALVASAIKEMAGRKTRA
jgi:AcrR family transcriptional regulator